MKNNILKSVLAMVTLLLISCNNTSKTENISVSSSQKSTIQVIQFHSENRCMTCNKIEALTLKTLESYPDLKFTLVNVDDSKNGSRSEQFEATGTALFLYNPTTDAKLDLTEFAFMTAGNEEKFVAELKKEIDLFLKS